MVMSLITNLTLEASNCSSCLQDGYHLLLPVIQLAALKVHPLTTDNAGQWSASVMLLSVYFTLSINSCYVWCSFIHSGYFYSTSSSPLLNRGAPDTARILCESFTPKRHRQLRVKNLPKVSTWQLERDSNPQHFGRKTTNLPRPTKIYFSCG